MTINVVLRYAEQPATLCQSTVDAVDLVADGIVLTTGGRHQLIPTRVLVSAEWWEDAT